MKTKSIIVLSLLALTIGVNAQITLQEPEITDSYMKFTSENTTNNYRFTLDTYEWADHGPQFQLTIESLDAGKPAQFTNADLSDTNYWEPMFRRITSEIAGEEMTAQDNVKRLYVKNVALLPNQFYDYENLHIIGIEATGEYTIPDGCFSRCDGLETFDCNVQGTLTIGKNIINDKIFFTVKVYTQQAYDEWQKYKDNYGSNFEIESNGTPDPNELRIISVSLNTTTEADGDFNMPDEGGYVNGSNSIVRYEINSFTAQTTEIVTELFMDYTIYPSGQDGQQHEWKQIHATDKGNGTWSYNGPVVNILDGLENYTEYRLEFSFNTNYDDKNGRAHYPTNGQTAYVSFRTGNLAGNNSNRYDLNNDGKVSTADIQVIINEMKK